MFLRRLDLVGFKSFAQKTSTELVPGISVVVGPNGSGKSNIADGVRWVLGEQSAKAVRARKPEEVIFAGSAARQPLGMAEVSLVLDNAEGSLPIEYAEVRVTRRLYRSGDSEYLLNGARVRLRDITQLLLHAGLSADSYTVIGQGSVDELILQRPDERRIAFENAADIRRHQLRLNDTRSKLAGTQANLVRVQDVLAELEPHVRRLKSQAERAARAESLNTELHDLLLRSFRARFRTTRAAQAAADEALREASESASHAEAATQAAEQSLAGIDANLAGLEEQLAVLRPRVDSFSEQARAAERALAVARERAAAITEQRALAESDLGKQRELAARLQREAAEHAGELPDPAEDAPHTPLLEELRGRVAELARAYELTRAERAQAGTAAAAAERRQLELEARIAHTADQLRELEGSLAVDQARQTDRDARLHALEQQRAQLEQERAGAIERLEQARTSLAAATDARRVAEASVAEAERALREAGQQADRLHGRLSALGAAELQSDEPPSLPAAWMAALEGLPIVGLAGELAARVRPIDRLVRGYLLRTVVLANDAAAREAFRRLEMALEPASGTPAWAVLSMDGLFLAPAGERPLEAASEDGASALLDWRREVAQVEAASSQAEGARSAAADAVARARARLDHSVSVETAARAALGEVEALVNQIERAASAAADEQRHVQAEQERAVRAAARHADSVRATTEGAERLRTALAAARAEREAHIEAARRVDERLPALGSEHEAARAELAAFEAAEARRDAERAAGLALRQRIERDLQAARAAVETAEWRLTGFVEQLERLGQRERQLTDELQATLGELAPVQSELAGADERRSAFMTDRRVLEQRLADLRTAERAAHAERESRHVEAQRAADELERLRTELSETAELDAESALAEQLRMEFSGDGEPSLEPHAQFDLEAARRRIATLQRELRAIGGVAESVVAEYREMSERHGFLEHQSADLHAAMAELQQAAVELEAHMRERFSEVFEAIQTAFADCFQELFGGGEARLVLTNPEDLLSTGIDIVARPPGKKLQGLLSLSGGERALTIVALLFGLLKVNPTPFCVLDEVDAALDEANVQRFANLLTDFARQIQFIVVTHNRATMDKADAMYGVSMDANGVSRVFSVKPRDSHT